MTSKQHRLYLYYSTIFLSILGSFFFFHHLTVNQAADYLYVEKCILCAISSFFNLFVLYYHYTRAPHPKFLVLRKRRISIFIHIASGLVEFFACWAAFLAGSPNMAVVAALAAICGHVPTSYYQTTIVFGSKAVMIAEYLFTISLHLFSAIRLLLEPTSVYWLLNMFLVHNIYVWVRVTYFLFRTVGVFKDSVYTGATLTSGMILFPAVLGVSANMLFLAFATLTILLYFVIVQPDETERVQFFNEGTRDVLVDKKVYETWINEQQRLATFAECDRLTDQQRAKQVFDDLDVNKDGKLDGEEITRLSKEWNVATSFIRRCKNQSKKSPLTFDLFYRNVWCRCEASTDIIDAGRQREVTAKARFVFKYLDPNHTGSVDRLELQKLLIQWGLPDSEADTYLSVHHEKKLSFNDFYSHFKPVWNFAYENLLVQDDGQMAQPVHRSDTK